MHIFFNGDSNLAGEELDDPSLGMANCIAKHFDTDYTNLSLSGAGNDYIYDTTMQWLQNNPKPNLVVIGWTGHSREQWWYNGGMHQVNEIGVGMTTPPERFQYRYEYWKDTVEKSIAHWCVMGYYWHNKITNMYEYLKDAGIPHLFFNTFNPFNYMDSAARTGGQEEWYYGTYEPHMHYTSWAKKNNYKEITPGLWHFEPQAHADWANMMINHIEHYKIYEKSVC